MKPKLRALLTRVQNLFAGLTGARKWARAHKSAITVALIAALHIMSMIGVRLPSQDIQHIVSALIGS